MVKKRSRYSYRLIRMFRREYLHSEEKVKEIREKLDMNSGLFSVYRDRLKRKGVIDTSEYGKITLTLPRFEEFVKTRQM